jgi:hypothetical protein
LKYAKSSDIINAAHDLGCPVTTWKPCHWLDFGEIVEVITKKRILDAKWEEAIDDWLTAKGSLADALAAWNAVRTP